MEKVVVPSEFSPAVIIENTRKQVQRWEDHMNKRLTAQYRQAVENWKINEMSNPHLPENPLPDVPLKIHLTLLVTGYQLEGVEREDGPEFVTVRYDPNLDPDFNEELRPVVVDVGNKLWNSELGGPDEIRRYTGNKNTAPTGTTTIFENETWVLKDNNPPFQLGDFRYQLWWEKVI